MARASTSESPIRFRGIPSALAAVVTNAPEAAEEMTVSVSVAGPKAPPTDFAVQTDFDPRILRVMLPANVAPGAYKGSLRSGEAERPVVVEVDPAPLLHVVPEQLRLQAHPGDLVGADLTMLNQGNVPVALRNVQAIGIFMSGGVERALRRAYVQKLADGQRRMDVIADSLADAHGGLLKMKIEKGAGEIEPGEVRELHVVLHIPSDIERGALYGGNWELPGLVYPITLQVAGEPAAPKEPEEAEKDREKGEKEPAKPKPRAKRSKESK
jgi:hypothetical protein